MRIKNLLIAGLFAVFSMSALTVGIHHNTAWAADSDSKSDNQGGGSNQGGGGFSADKCPAGSLYKEGKGKPASEIHSLADCNLPTEDRNLTTTVMGAINAIVAAVGIISVAVIVIGGVLYVTSTGDAAKTKRAMHTIMYAIVGLVISLLAFAIVNFVLKGIFE